MSLIGFARSAALHRGRAVKPMTNAIWLASEKLEGAFPLNASFVLTDTFKELPAKSVGHVDRGGNPRSVDMH